MYCIFATPNGSDWVAFGTVMKPFKMKRTLASNTQAAFTVDLQLTEDTAPFKPGQICRLDFGSSQYEYLVIVDGGNTSSHGAKTAYRHSYVVQELVCITREMHIQTAFFTGTSYTTPSAFFTRLFALTESSYTLSLVASGSGYDFMLAEWKQADYQVSSNSLFDNIVKIGMNNGVRFKAAYSIIDPGVGTIYLTAYKLTGDSTISSITGTLVADSTTYKGSNYAGKVAAVVSNVASDQFKWWPSKSRLDGARAEPSDQYAVETTEDDICLVLPHNIRTATKLRVIGFVEAQTDLTEDPYLYTAGVRFYDRNETLLEPDEAGMFVDVVYTGNSLNTTGRITEIDIVEYSEWLLLDATGAGSQENTLYYKRGENKIYNIKVCDGLGTSANSEWTYAMYAYNIITLEWELNSYKYQDMRLHLNKYAVYCNLYDDAELVMSNNISFQNNTGKSFTAEKRTAFYSQEDNQAAGKALASNMQGYIDSMNNGEYEASYLFSSYANIPTLGGIYSGMVLYEMDIDMNQSYIAVNLKFSDDLVPKSEYLSADGGINLPSIPLDKAYDRFTNYRTQMWFCNSYANAVLAIGYFKAGSYFNYAAYADDIIKAFDNGTTLAPIPFDEALMRFGDNPYVYTAVPVHSCALGNSVVVNFRTVDNRIVGRYVDDSTITNAATLRFYPVNFIDSDGICTEVNVKLVASSVRSTEATYPAIASATFNGASYLSQISDTTYYHDKAERPNITYQLDGKVYDAGVAGKVYQAFWEETRFFRDTDYDADLYTRYVTIDGTDYEIDNTSVTSTATSGVYLVRIYLSESYTGEDLTGETVTIFRKLIASPYTEETMLVASAAVVNASPDYVEFFIAFTK